MSIGNESNDTNGHSGVTLPSLIKQGQRFYKTYANNFLFCFIFGTSKIRQLHVYAIIHLYFRAPHSKTRNPFCYQFFSYFAQLANTLSLIFVDAHRMSRGQVKEKSHLAMKASYRLIYGSLLCDKNRRRDKRLSEGFLSSTVAVLKN